MIIFLKTRTDRNGSSFIYSSILHNFPLIASTREKSETIPHNNAKPSEVGLFLRFCNEKLPIEKDLPVYYYEYRCKDDSSITLNDGSHVVLVNCCYKGNDISEELRNFFDYIKTGIPTGEERNFVHRLEQEVAINRLNEEWEAAYMTFEEIVQMKERRAEEKGREEGRESLLAQLISDGIITESTAKEFGYEPNK